MENSIGREGKIEAIRQKCIEANPEIIVWSPTVNDKNRHDARTIRLADVLLATGAARAEMIADASWQEPGSINIFPAPDSPRRMLPEPTWCRWNGRKDDLTQQSDECINFLYDLLK